ncbi:MAG: hypothetical protein IPK60_00855 [Sandaracinaceae bacterium]|nr:hypothetical protein [Sandaracinaceae bacterium]
MPINLRGTQNILLTAIAVSITLGGPTARAQDYVEPAPATTTPAYDPPPPRNDPPREREREVDANHAGLRLAIQGRLSVRNLAEGSALGGFGPVVPFAAIGVRLVDQRLFLGLGLGFGGTSSTTCGGMGCAADQTTLSQSYVALSPVATFDVLREGFGALYLAGWFNFVSYSQVQREETGEPTVQSGGSTGVGLNLALGLRGQITPGVSLGTEWGWGFLSYTNNNNTGDADDESNFGHGVFGTIVVEGSIGI